jgi:membrane protein
MRLVDYFRTGIWERKLSDYSGVRRFLFKSLRIVAFAVQEYFSDQCIMRASALTFYTLVSIVPVITMVLAITRVFGLDVVVLQHVWASLSNQTALVGRVFTFANSLLKSTMNSVVAGVGIVVLLWTVTRALGNIEFTFDKIWEVARPRSPVRRVTDYVAMILVGTVGWLISVGLAIALQGQVMTLGARLGIPDLNQVVVVLLSVVRFLLIWVLFTAGYLIMTNARVRFGSSVLGGFLGALIYLIVEWIYVRLQFRVSSFGAVYGGFAAVPLFLAWVQITWMIVLFGAELAFSHEHFETYGFAPNYAKLSGYTTRLLKLRVMHLVVKTFEQGERALISAEISERVKIPVRLLRRLLRELAEAGLVTRSHARDERHVAYQPARSSDWLTLGRVIDAIDGYKEPAGKSETLNSKPETVEDALPGALHRFHDAVDKTAADVRLADIPLAETPESEARSPNKAPSSKS